MTTARGFTFATKCEDATKPVGSAWRFVGNHNDNRERHGQACTVTQHNGIGYPYTVEFADGYAINAVNRELEPLEESPAPPERS